jgi:hypothetical protein
MASRGKRRGRPGDRPRPFAGNAADPMAGSRVQQTCRAPGGANHRSREKRHGWNARTTWRLCAEGTHLLREADTWSGHRALWTAEGRSLHNPKRGVPGTIRREGEASAPPSGDSTGTARDGNASSKERRRARRLPAPMSHRHRCRPDQVNLAGQPERAKVMEGARERPTTRAESGPQHATGASAPAATPHGREVHANSRKAVRTREGPGYPRLVARDSGGDAA